MNHQEPDVLAKSENRNDRNFGSPTQHRRITPLRALLWVVIALLLLWILSQSSPALREGSAASVDFAGYWCAARIVAEHGNPYNPEEVGGMQQRIGWSKPDAQIVWNPPWIFPFTLPFALLAFWPARWVWFVLNYTLLAFAADWLWRSGGGDRPKRWLAALMPLVFIPSAMALNIGQISPLVLVGTIGFVRALQSRRDYWAGASTVLAALKPHIVFIFWPILVLWVLWSRRWMVALGALSALLVTGLLSLAANSSVYTLYWNAFRSEYGPLIWETPTLGTVLRLLSAPEAAWLQFVPTGFGLVLAVTLWFRFRATFDWSRHLNWILLGSILTASYTWTIDWVVLLPAVISVFLYFAAQPGPRWHILLLLALMQVALLIQVFQSSNYFFTLWMPPALALLYWRVERGQKERLPLVSAE